MNLVKGIAYSIGILILILFSISSVSAACLNTPSDIIIYSGGTNLGSYENQRVYVRDDLANNPLSIEYYFENSDSNCFSSNSDMKMQLFSSGSQVDADSFELDTDSNPNSTTSVFTFNFNLEFNLTSDFNSIYYVNTNDDQEEIGSVLLGADTTPPRFDSISFDPSIGLVKSGEPISIDYSVSDLRSGLDTLTVSGGTSDAQTFDNEKTFTGTYTDNPTSTTTYTLTLRDKLGYESQEGVRFVVDGEAPKIKELRTNYFYDGSQKVIISVLVEDDTFELTNSPPTITGDFSSFNSNSDNLSATCSRDDNDFSCTFPEVVIELDSTQSVSVPITLTDVLGNTQTTSNNVNMFVDKEAPVITDFYLVNDVGERNIFSSSNTNTSLVLRFSDKSIENGNEPRIVENLDKITSIPRDCSYEGDNAECVYDLGNSPQIYSNVENSTLQFNVRITDDYTNSAEEELTIRVDNIEPIITGIELVETDSIKDGLIKSQERFNMRIYVEDDNLFSNRYYITGDFSSVDYRDGKDEVNGVCSNYNSTTVRCDFNNIEAENGYLVRNITFNARDIAGNLVQEDYVIEILKVGDEVVSTYKIPTIEISNPINRNLILERSVTGWFEGEIVNMGDEEIKIVNYQLMSCDETGLDPLLMIDYSLYPNDIIINRGQEGLNDFILRMDVRGHSNPNDLNTKTLNCTMSILKRDNTQLFPVENVEFNMNVNFYDIPRGNLVEAHARDILDMVEEAEFLGSWFDSIYSIYSTMYTICNMVSGGGGVLAGVQNAWTYTSWAISGFPPAEPPRVAADTGIGGAFSSISGLLTEEGSFVKTACDFVTCRNGGMLGTMWGDVLGDTGLTDMYIGMCSAPAEFLTGESFSEQDQPSPGGGD